MSALTLLPAVDIADGKAAQVVGVGSDDPLVVAKRWVDAGATWVHLVDLDLAYGRGVNTRLISTLVAELDVPVQISGGLSNQDTLDLALRTGASRVNLASTALLDLDWVAAAVAEHGAKIAIGIDVVGEDVVARGTGIRVGSVKKVIKEVAHLGATTFIVADASRDGSRTGIDIALFERLAKKLPGQVIASGGVSAISDLHDLAAIGRQGNSEIGPDSIAGVVLGAALYHGAFTLEEAISALRPAKTKKQKA